MGNATFLPKHRYCHWPDAIGPIAVDVGTSTSTIAARRLDAKLKQNRLIRAPVTAPSVATCRVGA